MQRVKEGALTSRETYGMEEQVKGDLPVEGRVRHPKPEGWQAPDRPGRCNAWARQRGGACDRPAGWGTTHAGQGRCRYHGGCTPVYHGRYSTIVKGELEKALEHVQKSGDPLDILPELAFLRAILVRWISQHSVEMASSTEIDLPKIRVATDLIDQVGKTIGRIERIRALTALSRDELKLLIQKMASVVERVVSDPVKLTEIAGEWQQLAGGLLAQSADQSGVARAIVAAGGEE